MVEPDKARNFETASSEASLELSKMGKQTKEEGFEIASTNNGPLALLEILSDTHLEFVKNRDLWYQN